MKKLLLILLCLPLLFTNCKKDEESPNGNTNNATASITGSWNVDSVDLAIVGMSLLGVPPDSAEAPSALEFVQGGVLYEVFTYTQNPFTTSEIWQVVGDSLYIGEDPIGEDFMGTYSVTSTNLVFKGVGYDLDYYAVYATRN
jgi:hypothetical protein